MKIQPTSEYTEVLKIFATILLSPLFLAILIISIILYLPTLGYSFKVMSDLSQKLGVIRIEEVPK